MSEISMEMATSEEVVLTVLTHLNNGKIDDAIAGLSRNLGSKTTGLGWSLQTKSAWLNSSRRHGNFIQTLSCRLAGLS